MVHVTSELVNDELWLVIEGKCEEGSAGNYIADLVQMEIDRCNIGEIRIFVYDLRQAEYSFGDYLGTPFQFLPCDEVHLRVFTSASNHKAIRSLGAMFGADRLEIIEAQA